MKESASDIYSITCITGELQMVSIIKEKGQKHFQSQKHAQHADSSECIALHGVMSKGFKKKKDLHFYFPS